MKQWAKRIMTFLIFIMIFTIPMTEQALGAEVDCNINDGNIICNDSDVIYYITGESDKNHITVRGGTASDPIEVVLKGVLIDLRCKDDDDENIKESPLNVESGCYAIIYIENGQDKSGNFLYGGNDTGDGYAGLSIEKDATVTIKGTGELTAHGSGKEKGAAGIGGNNDGSVSNITIDSGTITATGGYGGAGIGGGRDGWSNNITINGGVIDATGGEKAPGIGPGDAVEPGDGGDGNGITINGGTINAKGGKHAAGIGGSEGGLMENITINGGKITATGGENGAGIGSEAGDCTNIKINGGEINALGGSGGAGIGSGRDAKMQNLVINKGTITAQGGYNAAGIGAGDNVDAGDGGNLENLEIYGGTITASGGAQGAGIGGSDRGSVNHITIEEKTKLNITAKGGEDSAGIGSANETMGDISIELNGGIIEATGGKKGAGIGGGDGGVGNISITGTGEITAIGGSQGCGIGGGENAKPSSIQITGQVNQGELKINAQAESLDEDEGSNEAAAIGSGGGECGDITIKNATLHVETQFFGAGIGTGMGSGTINNISLENCKIDVISSREYCASIGAGYNATVNNITIKNCDYNGGTIGGSVFSNHFYYTPNNIEAIIIESSDIFATAPTFSEKSLAAIGSGPYGGVGSITIKDSKVNACSAFGGAGIGTGGWVESKSISDYHGGGMGDIVIEKSTVEAVSKEGGAAIGGGFDTSVNDITITESEIDALSCETGGAGIGGGRAECAGNITISKSNVTATGGKYGAGIGSGGDPGFITSMNSTKVKSITIKEGSDIVSRGGECGAGVGTGQGGWLSDGILIENSNVEANGGNHAAGIGCGATGEAYRGGDVDNINIKGTSKVTASGGEGGAGIGGGIDGGASDITIALSDSPTFEYYVKATGGAGAAGIGSGGVLITGHEVFTSVGSNTDGVTISGGKVVAQGGGNAYGSGAGIGGGARFGTLDNMVITGGYIDASSGGSDAFDIGRGGKGNLTSHTRGDGDINICAGTVISPKISTEANVQITGGSVACKLSDVKNGGTKVYQTTMTYIGEKDTKVDVKDTSQLSYGTRDICSDSSNKVYLYLPESSTNKAYADVKVGTDTYHYYGTATPDGKNILKLGGKATLVLKETPVVGKEFLMDIEDENNHSYTFTAEGKAELSSATESEVTLKANDFGPYSVHANANIPDDDPLYWNLTADYSDNITMAEGKITVTENISKEYDGKFVTDPTVSKVGDGKVTFEYYQGEEKLSSAPKDAGKYTVVAKMAESAHYTAAESEPMSFTITPRRVVMALTAKGNGANATLTAKILGAVDDDGKVSFTSRKVNFEDPLRTYEAEVSNGEATTEYHEVESAVYSVTAQYKSGTNYICENVTEQFDKKLAEREVICEDTVNKTYGEEKFKLAASTGTPSGTDTYTYSVAYDSYPDIENAVTVEPGGNVIINNAGQTVIKVTLTDGEKNIYADAIGYITVNVARAPLDVTSEVCNKDGKTQTDLVYGKLGEYEYKLTYDTEQFKKLDDADNFTKGHGTLEVEKPSKTLCVNEDPYNVKIVKVGADLTINGQTYSDVFLSRNYELRFNEASFHVIPAELVLQAYDATGEWGTEPQFTYTMKGKAPWDDEIFEEEPKAGVDDYGNYGVGEHKGVITVTNPKQELNEKEKNNYTVTTENGDLTVTKASPNLILAVESKIYDGKMVEVSWDTAETYDGDAPVLTYYRVENNEKTRIEGIEAPTNAGSYVAEARTESNEHFTEATVSQNFRIFRGAPKVDLPPLKDLTMKDGLKLSAQVLPEGWTWVNGDMSLEVGSVRALAMYTPDDTENYYNAYRYLSFKVIAENNGNDANSPGTGDRYTEILWLILAITACICIMLLPRKRAR